MQNYKDLNNQLHVLESEDYEYLLPPDCVKITQEEAQQILDNIVITAEENKARAGQLLLVTDWVNQPDVTDSTITPHLLNKTEFDNYRLQLRQIAVNPESGNLDWPAKPTSQWST